jgi:acid phosphatase class B
MVVAKVMKRLAGRKQAAQKFDVERLNLKTLNELEVRKQYQISNRFAALENLSDGEDINRAWENIKVNTKTSAKDSLGLHEVKQHKLWFDEECLVFVDQRKQAKMQWVQDPNRSKVDNLNTVRS